MVSLESDDHEYLSVVVCRCVCNQVEDHEDDGDDGEHGDGDDDGGDDGDDGDDDYDDECVGMRWTYENHNIHRRIQISL